MLRVEFPLSPRVMKSLREVNTRIENADEGYAPTDRPECPYPAFDLVRLDDNTAMPLMLTRHCLRFWQAKISYAMLTRVYSTPSRKEISS